MPEKMGKSHRGRIVYFVFWAFHLSGELGGYFWAWLGSPELSQAIPIASGFASENLGSCLPSQSVPVQKRDSLVPVWPSSSRSFPDGLPLPCCLQEAEKMVASLQDSSLEEEHFTQAIGDHRNTAAALPLSHEAAMKWFYKDPQGEIQGELCLAWPRGQGPPEQASLPLVTGLFPLPARPLHDPRDG